MSYGLLHVFFDFVIFKQVSFNKCSLQKFSIIVYVHGLLMHTRYTFLKVKSEKRKTKSEK